MRRSLIAIGRLLRLSVHVLHGLALVKLRFGALDGPGRQGHIRWWSARTLSILGIELQSEGRVEAGPKLLVANHVSWLDIAVVHAVMPEARFVSKAAIKDWPLLGSLVDGAGTLYLERSSKRDALKVVHQAAEALRAGDTVAFFPEGTTGPGPQLLPFHGNLLQAAIASGVPVQPLMLRWHEPGARFSPAARFIGETTLVQSLWQIVCARGLAVQLQLLPVQATQDAERRALAESLRSRLATALETA
ncbi:lysophospholipid acyltransferase family protein [Roseateles violae]|uniref:Lysophospholipid acyltransferase family protein n=1 Tax=Roseateles violae TaxID=3058042 RepID=A0ABT8DRQ2_9BURK|nr:lysophospholipid acyltransferase family protein [Pelomonas sp. PFR6]MDN3921020.1 lysophospholipid acyltransferase family protein [Pelomonas sp. PFR6]